MLLTLRFRLVVLALLWVLLMHVVSVFILVMKSLELGVALQGFLQKSLGFSLLGLAHITSAYKFLYSALGAEWTWSGSNQLLLIVCLISLLSASKYKNFCMISDVLCKTLIWSELHSEGLCEFVLSFSANLFWVFSLLLNPKLGKSYVVLGFTANISHYSNSYLLLSVMPFESTASVWGFS